MSASRGRYGTGGRSMTDRRSTALLSPLEAFYGPTPVDPPEVPACPACGGRPCSGCGAVAIDLWGEEVTPPVLTEKKCQLPTLFD